MTETDQTFNNGPVDFSAEELEEVRRRRILAFLVDYIAIAVISFVVGIVVFFLGILTLGLAWLLYGLIIPVVAALYFVFTLASPSQATPGMRLFALKVVKQDGRAVDIWVSILHLLLFWAGNMVLPGFILLVSLFSRDKRLLHDILLGTVIVRSDT